MEPQKKHSIFDTTNPDNQLGPIVIAVLVTIVIAIICVAMSIHR